jgi:D-arabinose 1-dehydrogenase-like Zn-dependent alcohol dehydrogenase
MLSHEHQLFRIPPDMEDDQAVLLEPTAVAVHAVLRRLPRAGEKVLIVGAGTIGLLTLQVVRALAPQAEVSVLPRYDFQIEQAMSMGAAHILYARDSYESIEKTTGAHLHAGAFGNKMLLGGYDVIYDTVGSQQTVHDSLRWARAGGTVVMVGVNLHRLKLDLSPVWFQEVNLVGTMGHGMENWPVGTTQQRSTFAIASDLIVNGLIHPEKLITHRFALSNFREALETAADKKKSRAIKVIFDADLMPASSIPNARMGGRPAYPIYQTGEQPVPQLPANQQAQTAQGGPSHFMMAQSEDFTADFDNTQFVKPRQRRPPAALQFRQSSDESEAPEPTEPDLHTVRPMDGPEDATKPPAQALDIREEHTTDSAIQ